MRARASLKPAAVPAAGVSLTVVASILASWAVTARGGQDKTPSARRRPASAVAEAASYEYIGTKKCRMCHTDQHASWLESAKAGSWRALEPGANAEIKTRAGLDAQQDYRADTRCLRCHAVGYGRPGGYRIPDPNEPRSQRLARDRQGVGCEACHGPGSEFVKVMRDVVRKKRSYDPQELYAAGRRTVGRQVCQSCHNHEAVCMAGSPDNSWLLVDVTDRHGFHAEFPLKRRNPVSKIGKAAQDSPEHDQGAEQ